MGYRSCLGLIRWVAQYPVERMEAVVEGALLTGSAMAVPSQ